MKAYFFHLMPWTDFPADFDERYESSWVIFPNSYFDPAQGPSVNKVDRPCPLCSPVAEG